MATDNKKNQIGHILRCLRYPNYRLFFYGQIISLTGTWMQIMAMGWLVYRLTNSPFALGLIGFSSQVTTFFISPFAGVWADRWNRHRIIIVTQILEMLQALILAALVITGVIKVWHLVVLSMFLGLITSFDMPVRQSFTIDMIENKDDLGNAIALNSLMFNIARFLGPMLAGILVAAYGEGVCFLINGLSFIAVIIALLLMKITPRQSPGQNNHILESMKEGFIYTFGFKPMRFILFLMGLVSLVVMPYSVLMPAFVRDVLKGNSRLMGFLMGSAGMGALVGALFLAAKKESRDLGKIISIATFMFATGLILFSFSRAIWFSLFLMIIIGFGLMVHMASSNTVLQTIVDDDKRGRVMSFYIMAFIGLTPFGSLMAGGLAGRIGTAYTLMSAGILCIAGGLIFTSKMKSFNAVLDKEMQPSLKNEL